ncbi:MAG: TrkH family potassium uptake protein [Alphaproteobacteria bacterium]
MLNFRPILLTVGILLTTLALGMLVPAAVDGYLGHHDWSVFLASSAVTMFAGLLLILGNRVSVHRLTVRQAFVLTTLSWVAVVLFAALPFIFSKLHLSVTDAIFESVSGLSTTGATVIVGLDNAPPGILLWRALLNGLGGVGIVVMALAVLPVLRIGGMQIFRMESSDKSEKALPKTAQLASAIVGVYLLLIVLCALGLWFAGMSLFDSVAHAMAAVSTGGFSTKDASLGFYDNPVYEAILVVFMISGALPLTWYLRTAQKGWRGARDSQVSTFFSVLGTSIAVVAVWRWLSSDMSFFESLRHATFNVTSIIVDCGFVSIDYGTWGSFAIAAFILFTFFGGCTGSTTGSIKIFRWQILFRAIKRQLVLMFQPHRVVDLRYNGQSYSDDVIVSVVTFVSVYLITFGFLTVLVSLFNVDLLTSASAVSAALAGSGPGLGPIVGPSGTYQPLPDAVKWILSCAMLLGRLEIFTILVLFNPQFWRD